MNTTLSEYSNNTKISSDSMKSILEKLKQKTKRDSTNKNYFSIWRKFNTFLIKLDRRPDTWEERISLYAAFLVDGGIKSTTLRCYYSAIKSVLKEDGHFINDDKILLNSLARACRIVNDRVITRLPIRSKLLELLIFEVQRMFATQPYLEIMYKNILLLGYYGLFRIGELTSGSHPIKAADVHIAQNKDKMLFILHSSKTHGKESRSQRIKISRNVDKRKNFFCPFAASREYLALRGNYVNDADPFFVFGDNSPVQPYQNRKVLKNCLLAMNLLPKCYSFHSLRIGRSTDLILKQKYSIDQLKFAGRWRSNVVFKYIRNF